MTKTVFDRADARIAMAYGSMLDVPKSASGKPPRSEARARREMNRRLREMQAACQMTGNQVTALREELGLSAKEFALLCGVTRVSVQAWERQADQPIPHMAAMLCHFIDMATSDG